MLSLIKNFLSRAYVFAITPEDPYEKFLDNFELGRPAHSLKRDKDGEYLDPQTYKDWKAFCANKLDEIMAQW